MSSFQAPESFVIKSKKFFDLFQFFFLNAGVDVIETKDALFSPHFSGKNHFSIRIVAFAL